MSKLVIEYVFEGQHRGYNFTSATDDYSEAILKTIWRQAMSKGRGWGDGVFVGARSIKAFPLPDDQIAVSKITVTDLTDESGRRGIRRAEIDVMPPQVYHHHLQSRITAYPADVQARAKVHYNQLHDHFPRLKRTMPLILAQHFKTQRDWWTIEALILKLVTKPLRQMKRWERVIPFTTLALDHRDESRIIAVPTAKANSITQVPVFNLR